MRLFHFGALLLVPVGAHAADNAAYDGSWEVQLVAAGVPRVIDLTIKGETGTLGSAPWVSSKFGQCFNRSMPVAIKQATPEALTFDVTRSKVIPGCPDSVYKLKRVDADKLEGTSHRDDVPTDTNVVMVRK